MSSRTAATTARDTANRSCADRYRELESSIVIDAPVETVWAVVHDPATYVEAIDWVFDAWIEGDDRLGEGGVYVERAKYGLRERTYRWTVTADEPPNRNVMSHRSWEMEVEAEVLCEPTDDGRTQFTQRLRFRAFPGFRPLGYVLERTVMPRRMQRELDEMALPNIKRIVERHAAE